MSQGVHLRKYGVQTTFDFELYEVDGVDLRVDWIPAQADCEIMKDEGASTLCDNTATDEGSTYSVVLTATEMQFARGVLKIVDAATKVFLDKVVMIETYGNASAMHAFDLDTASVAQSADNETRLATNETEVGKVPKSDSNVTWNATALASIEAEAVDALESFNLDTLAGVDTGVAADGDLSPHVVTGSVLAHIMATNKDVTTSYNATESSLQALGADADAIVAGTITNAQGADVATDVAGMIDGNSRVDVGSWLGQAVTVSTGNKPDVNVNEVSDDATAADNLELFTEVLENGTGLIDAGTFKAGAIDASAIGADAITAAKIADDAIAAEHLATGAIVAATFAANAITSTVVADNTITAAKLNADCITNAKIADDAIGAENLATDAISADALSSGAVDEIWAKAMVDLAQGAPGVTASVLVAINWLYETFRNKTETTATRITIFKDNTTTELARSTISDDSTTFTKGEMVTGV